MIHQGSLKKLCEMRVREPLRMGEGRLTYRTDLALEYVVVKVSIDLYIVLSVDYTIGVTANST